MCCSSSGGEYTADSRFVTYLSVRGVHAPTTDEASHARLGDRAQSLRGIRLYRLDRCSKGAAKSAPDLAELLTQTFTITVSRRLRTLRLTREPPLAVG